MAFFPLIQGRKHFGKRRICCLPACFQTTKFWTGLNRKHLQTPNYMQMKKMKFVLEWIENILEKGENAGFQHFLLFPQSFQNTSISGLLKVGNA